MASIAEPTEQKMAKALAIVAKVRAKKPRMPDQLPLWDRNERGMPNAFARSALFNCNKTNAPRQHFKNHHIATLSGVTIQYTGEELRQDDADLFLEICHIAREAPIGERIEFTAYAMLKALGWGTNGAGYGRLAASIERLKANSAKVIFQDKRAGFLGSLVRKAVWAEGEPDGTAAANAKTRWLVYMEREIIALFGDDDHTRLARVQRSRLRNELAKWLHSYYYTHAQPFAHKVAFIHEKCGSQCKTLYHFRPILKRALAELESVGFLESWDIENDLVYVVRANQKAALADPRNVA